MKDGVLAKAMLCSSVLVRVYAYLDNHGCPLHSIHTVAGGTMGKDTASPGNRCGCYCGISCSPCFLALGMDKEVLELKKC